MAGLTNAEAQATLDARFPITGGTDFIAYSANGTTETGSLARTAVGATGWAAATNADPSVKANAAIIPTAAASAPVTITHFCVMSASTGGTQRTDWQAVTTAKTLGIGDAATWAIGFLQITLT